ncbi:hypothetical protein Poli38472_006460 [Pythium oligandrum]|uniref:Uncharacterized protein n=1 Tax=Pythium oligandrum TaxID=41045 RepID=A0A8K1C4Y0_PYTOL|nr:hypothetical protein Poli38472_006460 [Pythium oligandrum]|eukprot:TMW56450.1 hypothetical protein Poli38472_006460 [Pythium oligandrum]
MRWLSGALSACLLIAGAAGYECSVCSYAAWNCSLIEANETAVKSVGELRKVDDTKITTTVDVCDDQGKIQIDDVFCNDKECACTADRHCVNMLLGCQNLFQARSRKRCIGESAVQQRFAKCAVNQQLTALSKANLAADWVDFKTPQRCTSDDCLAIRRFDQCNLVGCGNLVVAWKEDDGGYRIIVDGSDGGMKPGTFLYSGKLGEGDSCSVITSTKIQPCYSLQTRNHRNGTCDGVYLKLDTALQLKGESYTKDMSEMDWPVWLTVVGSAIGAVGSVLAVAIVYFRHRRSQQDEAVGELLSEGTPSENPTEDQDDEDRGRRLSSSHELRQRAASPTRNSK